MRNWNWLWIVLRQGKRQTDRIALRGCLFSAEGCANGQLNVQQREEEDRQGQAINSLGVQSV